MKLSRVIELLGDLVLQTVNLDGTNPEISSVASNSRFLKPNDLFICIKGAYFDSHVLAEDLQEKGAIALIAEDPIVSNQIRIPIIYVRSSRKAEALLFMEQADHPYEKLITIGVTGTNGKTTVTSLVKHVLDTFEKTALL